MANTTTKEELRAPGAGACESLGVDSYRRRYRDIRGMTEALCAPLEIEDHIVQSMPDASPARWHLAHSTWFFEAMVLKPGLPSYKPLEPCYDFLFNSYYNALGKQHPKPQRGLITRPTVKEVYEYRHYVDRYVCELVDTLAQNDPLDLLAVIETGLHHEQQHQELLLTDVKHLFSCNPLYPAYHAMPTTIESPVDELGWTAFPERLRYLGHKGDGLFCYDNELPHHRVFVGPFELADRLVTNADYLEFINDGGYRRPDHWLSDGWRIVQAQQWEAPLYWIQRGRDWLQYTLGGLRALCLAEPVCHVSYFEADAYARWVGARLPTEAEWETGAQKLPVSGHFLEAGVLQPARVQRCTDSPAVAQLFGDVWEWTASPYVAYPGYRPIAGPLGEYNGKFMCNQFVLRGGSCVSPQTSMRPTYRNFFTPQARWQFTGIRLAR